MTCTKTKNLRKKNAEFELAKTYIGAAHEIMKEEYSKKYGRVKLTHFWIAEKLDIHPKIAFKLLILMAAHRRHFCIKLPMGPIFWDNDLIPCGVVFDAIQNAKAESRRLDQKLLMSMSM